MHCPRSLADFSVMDVLYIYPMPVWVILLEGRLNTTQPKAETYSCSCVPGFSSRVKSMLLHTYMKSVQRLVWGKRTKQKQTATIKPKLIKTARSQSPLRFLVPVTGVSSQWPIWCFLVAASPHQHRPFLHTDSCALPKLCVEPSNRHDQHKKSTLTSIPKIILFPFLFSLQFKEGKPTFIPFLGPGFSVAFHQG